MISLSLEEAARRLDQKDPLSRFRKEFHIPSLAEAFEIEDSLDTDLQEECTYLVGNSLGLQPKRTPKLIEEHLKTWRHLGVRGHFQAAKRNGNKIHGSKAAVEKIEEQQDRVSLPSWMLTERDLAKMMAPLLGAEEEEVAIMQTLTANLHTLMTAFYHPNRRDGRHKIIIERQAFPSDHFAVESQIRHHGLSTDTSMVLIEPNNMQEGLHTTESICAVIEAHAATTAMVILPGIQYYSGQLFDIPRITEFAQERGIFILWDLAHAVGNVELRLHDWGVDAAVYCTYKYVNAGPGSIGGLFLHAKHSATERDGLDRSYSGWWGDKLETRFLMDNQFRRAPGAESLQVSNPTIISMTSLYGALQVFGEAGGMAPLRERSRRLTAYLEERLLSVGEDDPSLGSHFSIITPRDPDSRGAQLSLLLAPGLVDDVMKLLEAEGVYTDERRPDVIRVAPAPLYNSFYDCHRFVTVFSKALRTVIDSLT